MSLVQIGSIVVMVTLAVLPTVLAAYTDGLETSESASEFEPDYR